MNIVNDNHVIKGVLRDYTHYTPNSICIDIIEYLYQYEYYKEITRLVELIMLE